MNRRIPALVLALLLLSARVGAARAEEIPALIRLHVVAASDSAADQAAKLRVRDACLAYARQVLADCPDADAAYAALRANRAGFAQAARRAAAGPVRVQTGVFAFPDRLYGDRFVPAGQYRALRVVVGAGTGHNWWCVLYPTLCSLDEAEYAAGEDAEIELYCALWEWLSGLWQNDADPGESKIPDRAAPDDN